MLSRFATYRPFGPPVVGPVRTPPQTSYVRMLEVVNPAPDQDTVGIMLISVDFKCKFLDQLVKQASKKAMLFEIQQSFALKARQLGL